jgi:hypothetical protein
MSTGPRFIGVYKFMIGFIFSYQCLNLMSNYVRALVFIFIPILTACTTTAAHFISEFENSDIKVYPPAQACSIPNKAFDFQFDQYKPVQTRAHKKREFAFAVAISGGGYRSANLALGVLLGLEQIKNSSLNENLLQEVDYFSTVSGGGLPVGFYLTRLHNFLEKNKNANQFSLANETQQIFVNDNTHPNPLRADLTKYFYAENEKVGLRIEGILNDTLLWTNQGGLTEKDIFIPKQSTRVVQLPYWLINTTVYQNASIFPFIPDAINTSKITSYYHRNHLVNYATPNLGYEMPMSVGLMASLSVPLALPATTLESKACSTSCYLHLYDGGIADNLGINTALNLLMHDKRKIKVLLVIDSGKDLVQPFSQFKQTPQGIPLTVRLISFSTDAYRKYIKSHLNNIAKKLLCSKNQGNVIIIYLDLEGYPQTQQIESKLQMSFQNQQVLLKVGQELVAKDRILQQLLKELNSKNLTLGRC